jgi:hypothetical protein
MIAATVAILLGAVVVLGIICVKQFQDNQLLTKSVKYYSGTYRTLQGSSLGHGSHHMMSFDGGLNWYDVQRQDGGGLRIIGPADPDLVRQKLGMRVLFDRVMAHGSIDPSDPAQVGLLTDAGFTVTQGDPAA